MYTPNEFEFLARHHCVLSVSVFPVNHLLVRLHIPVVVIFVFDRSLVKNLRGADMVVARKAVKE